MKTLEQKLYDKRALDYDDVIETVREWLEQKRQENLQSNVTSITKKMIDFEYKELLEDLKQ
jgi:dihydroneopterin aldolase